MGSNEFLKRCKEIVVGYYNTKVAVDYKITEDNVFIVWSSKTLQNAKAMVSTTAKDTRYFEITYNGDKQEFYVDAYTKEANYVIPFYV